MEASRTWGETSPAVVVAGGGLAGHAVAHALAARGADVLHAFDARERPGEAAAGLANPRMGPRATRGWRADEALDALDRLGELPSDAPTVRRLAVVRPATNAVQAERFAEADPANWAPPGEAAERWPWLVAPLGALVVPDARVADPVALVAALAAATPAVVAGARVAGWRVREPHVHVTLVHDDGEETVRADALIVCPGAAPLPVAPDLPLHRVKGQTVRVARPAALPADAPAVAGRRYVVPHADGTLVVGASHEHRFDSPDPDDAITDSLIKEIAALVPALAGATGPAAAGVRAHVPDVVRPGRLPLVGPWPPASGGRVWVLAGLGGRGLLTAPLLAGMLADALLAGAPLPPEVATATLPGAR